MSSYEEQRQAIKDAQEKMSYAEIKAEMLANSEHAIELDNIPSQNHVWIDRGLKFTCENAGHPYHEAWRTRKATV